MRQGGTACTDGGVPGGRSPLFLKPLARATVLPTESSWSSCPSCPSCLPAVPGLSSKPVLLPFPDRSRCSEAGSGHLHERGYSEAQSHRARCHPSMVAASSGTTSGEILGACI